MVWLTVATCAAVTTLALMVVVVHALKFARWAIEREDRFVVTHQPLTAALKKMKIESLTRQRKEHEERWSYLLRSGFNREVDAQRMAIVQVDEAILAAERAPLEEGPGG